MSSLSVQSAPSLPGRKARLASPAVRRALLWIPVALLVALAPSVAASQLLLLAGLYGAVLIGLRLRQGARTEDIWQRLCARANARLVDLDAQISVEGDLRGRRAGQLLVTDRGLYLATLSRGPLGAVYQDVRVLHGHAAPWVPDELRCVLVEPPTWEEDALVLHLLDPPSRGQGVVVLRVYPSDPRALRRRLPKRLSV